MNVAATFLAAALVLGVLAALAGSLPDYVLKANLRAPAAGLGTALAGAAGVVAGIAAMTGDPYSASVPGVLPLTGVRIELDPLSGPFLAAVGVAAVATGVYAVGDARSRVVQSVVPLFVIAMLLVPAAGGVGTFLAAWELVAATSLVLILVEHRRSPEVAVAGRWYAALSQLGFLTVLIGLLMLAGRAGDSFADLRDAHPSAVVAGLAFVLTLVGFTTAAGIAPLHVWLPRAHTEAPSQVSALMSAAMVTLGGYGIVRIGLDLLAGGPRWWWLAVLGLGALSAVAGPLRAAPSGDLKRLLTRSTIGGMGLVFVGIGAAGLFAAAGQRVLAGLALTAALLHVLGHAAATGLLFLATGSVVRATGTRELETLGGLRRKMPWTTAGFGLGALAGSALPPGTAFVSVWLLLQALVHTPPGTGTTIGVAVPVAVAAVALSVGLAVSALARAFGVGFLARPRSAAAEQASESPPFLLAGLGLAGLASVVLALGPTLVLPALGTVSETVLGEGERAVTGAITVRVAGVAGTISPLLITVALAVALALAIGGTMLLARRRARRAVPTWDGGAGPAPRRATTFAVPAYSIERTEGRLWRPALAALNAWGEAGRALATGSVHRYVGYGFYAVCALLAILAVTR
ncbi:MAG TPA: proton-conducting transporter membrane subunit [Actinophytocola sp.]|jgi:formate hydrogenlyase subunit 3/multisubunit Na+/H+ antiporter MnhD subunit|uniref:proton-conducting transporter transmembrane domain-containing protein n=1 Tax=Actinophytocola sp. TaxID=1872138 RepID=UPI002F941EB3